MYNSRKCSEREVFCARGNVSCVFGPEGYLNFSKYPCVYHSFWKLLPQKRTLFGIPSRRQKASGGARAQKVCITLTGVRKGTFLGSLKEGTVQAK
jgi:hypothetical protein